MIDVSTLRLIKHESFYLTTFETDPDKDPDHIYKVSASGDKEDNLFPSLLPPVEIPRISDFLEVSSPRKRYGHHICFFKVNYEWCPYLPAVVNFHYPIFRGMKCTPDIVHDGSGYKLEGDQIVLWQNVEYVMLKVAAALGSRQLVGLDHQVPEPPSEFGYTRSHSQAKFATKCVLKSLNAFQRLLAYCSYCMAGAISFEPLGPHATFYSSRVVTDLYKKLDPTNPCVHILAKLLLSTLWEIRASRNFAGVVIHPEGYDHKALNDMIYHRVPVYVAWPGPGKNPYVHIEQSHYLKQFFPTKELYEDLERSSMGPAAAPPVKYGVPPAPRDSRTFSHPMDYVRMRLREIPKELEKAPNGQQIQDRLKSARKLTNMGTAQFYRFDPVPTADGKERWTRTNLFKQEATRCFEDAEASWLWYDCVQNDWNYSEEFNIKNNMPSTDPASPCVGMDVLESREAEEEDRLWLVLEEGELADDSDVPPPKDKAPVLEATTQLHDRYYSFMRSSSQFSPDGALIDGWYNEAGFLYGRYGLSADVDQEAQGVDLSFALTVGLPKGSISLAVSHLVRSCTGSDAAGLPSECDLSPGYQPADGRFPNLTPKSLTGLREYDGKYLLGVNRSWMLLIGDPLTLVQIEREGWDVHGDGLVFELIKKGLQFEILYPTCQRGTAFYPHPGPVVHPDAVSPTHRDYLSHRLDLMDFFKHHPHAYAAALCAGGILWRLAVDVLPLPDERQILRPFHPQACVKRTVDGQRYWTPRITTEEENVIVGVYLWAVAGQSIRHDSWWPKPTAWVTSGLEFGAWSPSDEVWYSQRRKALDEDRAKTVTASNWKSNIKFQRPATTTFLTGARAFASSFIREQLLRPGANSPPT